MAPKRLFLLFAMMSVAESGKTNFCQMVSEAKNKFGTLTGKISSHRSTTYSRYEDYSLLVFYKKDGDLKFSFPAQSWGGRFFHVSIQKVADWPAGSVHDNAGRGMVHDYHHKEFTGVEYTAGTYCVAAGAVRKGDLLFRSSWINPKGSSGCTSDGDKSMTVQEQAFVRKIVEDWMRTGSSSTTITFENSFIRQHCR